MTEQQSNEAAAELPASEFGAAPAAELSAERPAQRTLPPPEWLAREAPRSTASLALERYELAMPVPHRVGPRAELASLAARLAAASEANDSERERVAAAALARALAARGTELESATRHARRSLLLGEDPVLREELAGWFASLGEPSLAANTLRPLLQGKKGAEAAAWYLRVAVLLGRAGDAEGQRDALTQAAADDPSECQALELFGAIGAWAPNVVTGQAAALAYLEAATRRERLGERSSAFEDLLRAYEMAPEYPATAQRLAHSLGLRGRAGAADEVYREHARALGAAGAPIHLERMRAAVSDGDLPRALGAALDAGLDASFDRESLLRAIQQDETAPLRAEFGFDELLERTGLHELFAARLELGADAVSGAERAAVCLALGRLYAGPLARTDRAVEVWIDALVADPGNAEVKSVLRHHASATRDGAPLLEALLRIGSGEPSSERNACLRELALLAEERWFDPALASWAIERLLAVEPDEGLREAQTRLMPRAQAHAEALAEIERDLETASGDDRIELLARLVPLRQGRPESSERLLSALRELCRAQPAERPYRILLERVLARRGQLSELQLELERSREAAPSSAERARLALLLAQCKRRQGDLPGALQELAPLLDEPGAHAAAWSAALLLAAQCREPVLHTRALLRVATQLASAFRGTLSSVAAERLWASGDLAGARSAADQACHADPSLARPIATRALVGLSTGDRWGAEAMERAMGVIVPRAELCRALARTYESLDEPLLSMAFTQRLIALRPGDLDAARQRLERVTRAGDGSRLADALAWLLSQPEPLSELSELLDFALRALARLDATRASGLARRALDVIGPRSRTLREAVLAVSDLTGERGLGIAVIERYLAAGAAGEERTQLFVELARRRREAGDPDGAARALLRAVREGAIASVVLAELEATPPTKSSDGELAVLEARAEALSGSVDVDQARTALAWREVGAAYFDFAGDAPRAIRAWERAAALNPDHGVECLAGDLVSFVGPSAAVTALLDLVKRRPKPKEGARVLAIAASVALTANDRREAFRLAARALELDLSRTEVLAVAERAAGGSEIAELQALYDRLAETAFGSYGERAVHYRAARHFEKRNEIERALGHAVRAFEAVPSEGAPFLMMARLAERSSQNAEVVRAIERVAQRHDTNEARAGWLRRAALFAGPSEEGQRQRVEVLLRALSVRPEVESVRALAEALRALLVSAREDRELLELRFEKAVTQLLPKLDGPEGARIALACAVAALETFGASRLAVSALARAVHCDGDLEEFKELFSYVSHLAAVGSGGSKFVLGLVELATQKFGGAGSTVLDLGARLANALGDHASETRLLVAAAKKEPENASLVRRADTSARALGDPELLESVLDAIPVRDRASALLALADAAEAAGDPEQAQLALGRARAVEGLSDALKSRIFERLCDVLRRSGRRDDLELVLEKELSVRASDPESRSRLSTELAALIAARGDPQSALELLRPLLAERPDDETILSDLAAYCRQTGDKQGQLDALTRLFESSRDPEPRLSLLRQSAVLLEELGQTGEAANRWLRLLELAPNDLESLAALERDAEQRGDYEALIGLLQRRAELAERADEVRPIRLRRAAVLEQHLGRIDEARVELETLLAETGDDLSVLRVLADLQQRLGAPLRAAPLWLRASAVAQERDEAADFSQRACEAYLEAGDVDSARLVLEGMGTWVRSPQLLELAVEVERRRGNPRALAEALDELATASSAPAARRAEWLVEGARAWLAADDRELALSLAMRAARIAPESGPAQLLARMLEYSSNGPGDAADARVTLLELRGIRTPLGPDESEQCAFLTAEALDLAAERGAGQLELERARQELGERPLIALGLAERSAARDGAEALRWYDLALAGDLQGLRTRGRVALAAARVAESLEDSERALGYLAIATSEPESRADALREGEQRSRRSPAPTLVSAELSESAVLTARGLGEGSGVEEAVAARTLVSSGAMRAAALDAVELGEASKPRTMAALAAMAGRYSQRPEQATQESLSGAAEIASARPAADSEPDREPDSEPPASPKYDKPTPAGLASARVVVSGRYSVSPPATEQVMTLPRAQSIRPTPMRSLTPPTEARAAVKPIDAVRQSGSFSAGSDAESALFHSLQEGSLEAGVRLVKALESRANRTQDLVMVCRRVALLAPGDVWAVAKLHEAALADRNQAYARAIEHVLGVLVPGRARIEPPPLVEQVEQPDAVRAMLFRDSMGPVQEALAIVWEGAEHVFRRDASTYGITGMERVPHTAGSPLARVYAGAARALALTRTPLFQRRSQGPITVNLALLAPPAVILSGEVQKDTPELRFHLGAMLAASIPQYALLFGSPESQARAVLKALGFAFGPPRQTNSSGVLNLAEVLWESIPARFQRRLRELCDRPEQLDYDQALAASRIAVRRAGLFVAGDLGVALNEAAGDDGLSREQLRGPNALSELSRTAPSLRSLLTLALSPEYAETRWQFASRTGTTRF